MTHPARQMSFPELYRLLQEEVAAGNVFEHAGSDGNSNLRLYCYTDQCVYERKWNDISMMARGLILDIATQEVVATPFPKFFNVQESMSVSIPDIPFETFEKLDGSLIIIFYHAGKWKCSTKGSLSSEQAKWAQELVDRCYSDRLHIGVTYLCEAIYPQNRIVVNYSPEMEGLHLLAAYWEDGTEYTYEELKNSAEYIEIDVVERHSYDSISELLEVAGTLDCNSEGFVLRFNSGLRVKIKGEEYCRVHRMVSRLTPLAVWELMAAGEDLEEYRRHLPEEFWDDFDSIVFLLSQKRDSIFREIVRWDAKLTDHSDKEIGLMLKKLPPEVQRFIFSYRKKGTNMLDIKARERKTFYDGFRPTGNRLEGYRASSSVARVQESE